MRGPKRGRDSFSTPVGALRRPSPIGPGPAIPSVPAVRPDLGRAGFVLDPCASVSIRGSRLHRPAARLTATARSPGPRPPRPTQPVVLRRPGPLGATGCGVPDLIPAVPFRPSIRDPGAGPAIGLRVPSSNPRRARPGEIRRISGFLRNCGRFSDDYLERGACGESGLRETDADRMTHRTGRAEGPIMRQPTEGNGPRGTIRIFDTLAVFDAVVPPTVYPERPTSSVEGPRPAQQNHETNPMLIWEEFADRPVLEGWCRLSQNLQNEPNVNLDKICGPSRLVRGFHCIRENDANEPNPAGMAAGQG